MMSIRISFVVLAVTLASSAAGQIVPPGSEVAGKSIGEWTHDWWNWAAPYPSPVWPPVFDDGLSASANTRQDGPVFFVPDDVGGMVRIDPPIGQTVREFDVPSDKYLLVNVYGQLGGFAGADPVSQAAEFTDSVESLSFSLDGEQISSEELLANYREASGEFTLSTPLTGPQDNVYFLLPGDQTVASDGYWIMLEPLMPGEHVLEFGGVDNSGFYRVDVRSTITSVVPEPSSTLLLILGLLISFVGTSRRRVQ